MAHQRRKNWAVGALLRQLSPQSNTSKAPATSKSDSAKDAQILRIKERVRALEEQVRTPQEENELLYGKLTNRSTGADAFSA